MLGIAFGLGLGSAAGLALGPYIFSPVCKPRQFDFLPYEADKKEEIEVPPLGTPVPEDIRALLPYTEPWTVWPDVQRVTMINRLIAGLWPTLTKAILAEVLRQVQFQLQSQVFDKIAIVEDILVAGVSWRNNKNWVASDLNFDDCTFGDVPLRLGGMKPYFTGEDEVIMDVPVVWGSNMKFKVEALLRVGPARIRIPVIVSNVQFKVDARITLKPLTTVLPCVGGLSISLMEVPLLDFSLELFRGIDIMALPLLNALVRTAVEGVMNGMMVYPNRMTVPIMENFGLLPPAQGAVQVKLIRVEAAAKFGYVLCEMSVRTGRVVQSSTVKVRTHKSEMLRNGVDQTRPKYSGNWDQDPNNKDYTLVVDDFEKQALKLHLWAADKSGSQTQKLANAKLRFGTFVQTLASSEDDATVEVQQFNMSDWVKNDNVEHEVRLDLVMSNQVGGIMTRALSQKVGKAQASKTSAKSGESIAEDAQDAEANGKVIGVLVAKVKWMPFIGPDVHDAENAAEATPSASSPSGPEFVKVAEAAGDRADEIQAAKPEADAAIAPRTTAEPATPAVKNASSTSSKSRIVMPSLRAINANLTTSMRGVLTVKLIRCTNLDEAIPNFYVRMLLMDPVTDSEQVHRSSTIINEVSPRWGQMFDFVMISVDSTIYFNVHAVRSGVFTLVGKGLSKLNPFAKKAKEEDVDMIIGKLQMPLRDVAANSCIKDVWTLNDAEKGEIELELKWQTVMQ